MKPKRDILTNLAIGAAVASIVLTAIAFWLSFAHLESIAAQNGLNDERSWAWPAAVDLFIIIGESLMLRAALKGQRDWWAIGLTVFGSATSIGFNIFGVGANAQPMEYAVAAVPPTAALVAFAAVMRQLHTYFAARVAPAVATPAAPAPEPVATPAIPAVATPPALPAAPVATPRRSTPRATVAAAAAAPRRSATASVAAPKPATPDTPASTDMQHIADAVAEAERIVATDLDGVQLLTVADVATLKGVAAGTVRSWKTRGRLVAVRQDEDGRSLFHPNDVAALD